MSTTPVTPSPAATDSGTNGLPSGQSLNNMFLQLLVAQLQNQDPTNPVDPSQFVGQLAQFSELSEVTSIYTLLQQVVPVGTSGSSGGTSPTTGSSINAAANPAAPATAALTGPPSTSVPATAATFLGFASPTISALTSAIPSKIQGVF